MRIGIYGGTFDPIHLGHLTAAQAAMEELRLDKLLLIPAAVPPHKALKENSASAEQRLAMTTLGAESLGIPGIEVSDIELKREGKSYTVDTLRALHEQYPEDELWLLMGTDMLESFAGWYEPDEILCLASLCASGRNEEDSASTLERSADALRRRFPGARIHTFVNERLIEISSTQIRAGLKTGESERYLAPAVYGYILREQLYGTETDLKDLDIDTLRPIALSFLRGKRIPHVLGTEETAVHLAEEYGANVEDARRAALLHDCTKRLSLQEHLALAELYGIEADEVERSTENLMHARTGAAVARDLFAVNDEVYKAIRWHTTGHADMTTLERVIYIADIIEPSRNFSGVDELRAECEKDPDAGLRMSLERTVKRLGEQNSPVQKNTLEALSWMEGRE